MSDNNDNKILIKFEIHVPVGAGPAPVVINPPAAAPPAAAPGDHHPPPAAPPAHGAASPVAAHSANLVKVPAIVSSLTSVSTPSLVKVNGSGTTGDICVQAQQDSDPICGAPVEVRVAVHVPGADISAIPPLSTTPATPVPAGGSFFNWKAVPVPGAVCEWPASGTGIVHGARNELVIWRRYSGEAHWSIEVIIFRGICNNSATDCDIFVLPTAALAAKRLETVPASLEIAARGFGGALERLNQTFCLTYVNQQVPGIVQWASAGDGDKLPRAALTCRTSADVCELLLEVSGKRIIYRLPAAGFQPLSANRLQWSGRRDGLENSKFPTEVSVIPAQ